MRMLPIVVVLALGLAAPASAQHLVLQFSDGRVSVDATNVPLRTVLSEWARLGSTKMVNADRVSGSPLTVKLENVPEAQALEIILRNVAGYMVAPRAVSAAALSRYDRIVLMPTTTAAAAGPATAGGRFGNDSNAGLQRNVRPGFGANQAGTDEAPQPPPDGSDTGVNEPPFGFPQNPFQQVGQPGPFGTPIQPGAESPVVQFGPTGGSAVTVNPTPQQTMPVLQFPGMTPPPAGGVFGGFGAPPVTTGGFGTPVTSAPAGTAVPGMTVPVPGMVVQPGQVVVPPGQKPPGQ
ncbi:MAG: hypothetical protein IT178_16005 [Acidobacteria bacterium]|nr:hypothetical protein [Acidobacteriota bacterium]